MTTMTMTKVTTVTPLHTTTNETIWSNERTIDIQTILNNSIKKRRCVCKRSFMISYLLSNLPNELLIFFICASFSKCIRFHSKRNERCDWRRQRLNSHSSAQYCLSQSGVPGPEHHILLAHFQTTTRSVLLPFISFSLWNSSAQLLTYVRTKKTLFIYYFNFSFISTTPTFIFISPERNRNDLIY